VPVERRDGYRLWIGGPVAPGAAATTLGSWVSVRTAHADDDLLVRHERVHVEQFRAHGVARFLGRYLASYLGWRLRGYPHWSAYRRIPFEVEAEWGARRGAWEEIGSLTSDGPLS
jgi:hypothetical protein